MQMRGLMTAFTQLNLTSRAKVTQRKELRDFCPNGCEGD